jgi:hypothetical protein
MTNNTLRWAAGWAAAYGTLALGWSVTGHGYPYGEADRQRAGSALGTLDAHVGAPVFAGVLLVTALVLVAMHGRDLTRGPLRAALLGWVWTVAALLLLVVADVRLLTFAGYLPILVIGFPFGYPPVDYSHIFTWTLANEVLAVAGGVLLIRATVGWHRRTRNRCVGCGRGDAPETWTAPGAAARWGRWATWTAALIPATYAVIRLAWAAGIPLGISRAFLDDMHRTGLVWAGAGLGAFALAGALLTTGLTLGWGERFPRWMIGLAGKRVPIKLATVPATLVALFVASAATAFLTTGGLGFILRGEIDATELPFLLMPLWSAALGAATYAFYLRRRGSCPRCGTRHETLVPAPGAGAY